MEKNLDHRRRRSFFSDRSDESVSLTPLVIRVISYDLYIAPKEPVKAIINRTVLTRTEHYSAICIVITVLHRESITSHQPRPGRGQPVQPVLTKNAKMAIDRNCSNLESRVFLRNSERVNTSIKAWRPIPRNTSEQGLQPALP